VEVLEKEIQASYDRERVRAENDAAQLESLKKQVDELKAEVERLKALIGTPEVPGEVVRNAVDAAEEALIVRLANLNEKMLRDSFEQCRNKVLKLYPDCDLSGVQYESDLDQDAPGAPSAEEGEGPGEEGEEEEDGESGSSSSSSGEETDDDTNPPRT